MTSPQALFNELQDVASSLLICLKMLKYSLFQVEVIINWSSVFCFILSKFFSKIFVVYNLHYGLSRYWDIIMLTAGTLHIAAKRLTHWCFVYIAYTLLVNCNQQICSQGTNVEWVD